MKILQLTGEQMLDGSTLSKNVENLKIHGVAEKSQQIKCPYLRFPRVRNPKSGNKSNISKKTIEKQKVPKSP